MVEEVPSSYLLFILKDIQKTIQLKSGIRVLKKILDKEWSNLMT